jgi:HSP20 family protein
MASFFNKLSGIKEDEVVEVNGSQDSPIILEDKDDTNSKKDKSNQEGQKDWLDENYEGQLSVDVFGTQDEIVIKSTIAGVKPEDIDISISNDMLTIRGERAQQEEVGIDEYYYQECYWGGFSRSIILPVEVEGDKVSASLKNGVLTVRLPKARRSKSISVKVKEE